MKFEQLEYLIKIASFKSLNSAANYLHISQQYLSRIIKNLEDELEVKIFERSSTGITLTKSGNTVLDFAKLVIAEKEKMLSTLHISEESLNNDTEMYSIDIVSTSEAYSYLINSVLLNANFSFPTKLNCSLISLYDCMEKIKNKSIDSDIIIMHNDSKFFYSIKEFINNIYYVYILFTEIPLLFAGRHSQLADLTSIQIENLTSLPLVIHSSEIDLSTSALIFKFNNIQLNIQSHIEIVPTYIELISSGQFYGIGTASSLTNYRTNEIIGIPISNVPFKISTGLLLSKSFSETKPGTAIKEILLSAYQNSVISLF